MRADWDGLYFDGRLAARQAARVHVTPSALELTIDGTRTLRWPYEEIQQTQGFYPGEHVRLERAGGALVVTDPAFLAVVRQIAGARARHVHDPSRRWLRAGLAVPATLAVIAVTAVLYLWAIPALATALAPLIPPVWEERFGRAVVEHLVPEAQRCSNPARAQAIDTIVATLAAPLTGSSYTFHVVVVNSPVINAVAAPGGYVVIFRGLLERTESAEELAGVLAHEIQHIARRHVARALVQQASTGLVVAALTGDATGIVALEAARALGSLRYSRQNELEADAEGMRLLVAAGIDPAGMIAFYETLRKVSGEDRDPERSTLLRYLSTHPPAEDRIERLTALAAGAPRPPAKLLPGRAWTEIRTLCRVTRAAGGRAGPLRGHGRLYFVPLGDFPPETVDRLTAYYAERFEIRIETLPAVPLDPRAFDSVRGQLVAEELVRLMARHHAARADDPEAILIGLTRGDMYIRRFSWRFAFASGVGARFAVVSSARMNPRSRGRASDADALEERLRKMISRQIGILHFGLAPSADPASVMYGEVLGLDDLDRLAEDF